MASDLIFVMNEGRIVEQGTHEELMRKGDPHGLATTGKIAFAVIDVFVFSGIYSAPYPEISTP